MASIPFFEARFFNSDGDRVDLGLAAEARGR